jgi:O-antigen/teichoic acid export membrane protein
VGVARLSTDGQTSDVASDKIAEALDSTDAGGRIVRGGVLRFGSYVSIVGLSIISAALLTRHLGVARFGQYTTVISLVGIVASITDAGMSTVGVREFAVRNGSDRDVLMRDLLGLRVTLTTVGVVLATAFALAADYDAALLVGTVLASLGTVALVVQHTYTIPLASMLRLGTLSALDLVRQVLTVAAIVALVAVGAGVLPLLAVTLAVNLLLVAPTAVLARNQISLRMSLNPRRWSTLLRLTVSFSLATAVGTIYIYTAQILTSLVASAHQSGLFAASFRVFIVAGAVPGLLVSSTLPLLARAARDDRERLAYALQRIFEVSLILGVAAALGTLAGARFIIHVVAGPKYAAAGGVLRIQGLALIASFLLAGWSFALLSLKHYGRLLVANAVAFAVSCSLTLVLAGAHGARGAALATVCGEATIAVGSLLALLHGHPELRPRLTILPKVMLAAAPGVALALASGLPSIVCALLAVAIYGLLIAVTRAAPREIIDIIPSTLRTPGRRRPTDS